MKTWSEKVASGREIDLTRNNPFHLGDEIFCEISTRPDFRDPKRRAERSKGAVVGFTLSDGSGNGAEQVIFDPAARKVVLTLEQHLPFPCTPGRRKTCNLTLELLEVAEGNKQSESEFFLRVSSTSSQKISSIFRFRFRFGNELQFGTSHVKASAPISKLRNDSFRRV